MPMTDINVFRMFAERRLSTDDGDDSVKESGQLLNTFYINMIIFWSLMTTFELVRNWKSIYLNRLTKKLVQAKRVPPPPSRWPFAWVYTILLIPNEEVLRMVGLDGYMLLRFLLLCIRIASFFTFFGLIVLVPVYAHGEEGLAGWNKYTVANIKDAADAYSLWAPVCFAYLFSIFFCQIFYYEYKNFIHKRVMYLVEGDLDTQIQTNHTVCIENIPPALRSTPMLADFFERLFPGDVYNVEIALDLKELEDLTLHRRNVRNKLEKAIAVYKATSQRPTVIVKRNFYTELEEEFKQALQQGRQNETSNHNNISTANFAEVGTAFSNENTSGTIADLKDYLPSAKSNGALVNMCGYEVYDSIQHYTLLLLVLNKYVYNLQVYYNQQRQRIDLLESNKLQEIKEMLYIRGLETGAKQVRSLASHLGGTNTGRNKSKSNNEKSSRAEEYSDMSRLEQGNMNNYDTFNTNTSSVVQSPLTSNVFYEEEEKKEKDRSRLSEEVGSNRTEYDSHGHDKEAKKDENNLHKRTHRLLSNLTNKTTKTYNTGKELAKLGVENLTKESMKTAEYATKGVLRGVLEATRALELLTIGAYYRISSTAFVTFKSRVSTLSACNILLSHDYYRMTVNNAANSNDIIWENISIPVKQIRMRTSIANSILAIGALFWSLVVAFISAVTSLESISEEIPALKQYSNTEIYNFFNYYLAIGILLILLALLPFVFDFISRSYEGIKEESEIQNSILHRYFNYQLANVFVAVGLGSIATSVNQIIDNPSAILSILGNSVASFSIYFANLIITRTFTGIPIEMLRIFNLIDISLVYLCHDKKKCTRRDLRTGAFADCPMLYGWIYPNILMGLMIMVTYACISPFILPLCLVFFACLFLMYKYQLLYVYINKSQAGGYMWYTLFNQSMLVLMCGVLILTCYLAIRQTYISGPFYAMLPLPLLINFFWRNTNKQFQTPAHQLSLERAKEIDRAIAIRSQEGLSIPLDSFKPTLYRQPSLAEGALTPAPYRHCLQKTEDSALYQTISNKQLYNKYLNNNANIKTSDSVPSLEKELLSSKDLDGDDTNHDVYENMDDLADIDREVSIFLTNYGQLNMNFTDCGNTGNKIDEQELRRVKKGSSIGIKETAMEQLHENSDNSTFSSLQIDHKSI